LAGPFDISPTGAGFGSYVKLHKPYFVGRTSHIAREKERNMEVARFRMNERGVRMPKTGDPVVNRRGRAVGWVTSAAVDVDGRILGLAYVESRYHREGAEIGIFSLPARPLVEKCDKAELEPGDTIQLPAAATILTRFPDRVFPMTRSGRTGGGSRCGRCRPSCRRASSDLGGAAQKPQKRQLGRGGKCEPGFACQRESRGLHRGTTVGDVTGGSRWLRSG
jgi:hypothetical protein